MTNANRRDFIGLRGKPTNRLRARWKKFALDADTQQILLTAPQHA
jgi:hypothetical protein